MKFLTSLFLIITLAVPVSAIGPGERHDNQQGKGHANHKGNGWGHHEKPPKTPKPPFETDCQPRPRPPPNNRNTNTNHNTNINTNRNTNTNRNINTNTNINLNLNKQNQSQSQNVANNIDIAFGDISSGGTTLAGGFGNWGYQDTWRQVYQATPWEPVVAPIQPVYQYEQRRPRAETYLAAPSFMHDGKRYVIME